MTTSRLHHRHGFSSAELLMVLAVGSLVIGASMVAFGTVVKNQPRVASVTEVEVGLARMQAYYNESVSKKNVLTAPNYGAVSLAEKMREQFNSDVLSATAVYCLARDNPNTFHPYYLPYTPGTDAVLDTSLKFREHLITRGLVASGLYKTDRNFSPSSNASIFILGYSKVVNELNVAAVYDIDVVRTTGPAGFYASVKRYQGGPREPGPLIPRPTPVPDYYDIFYPPSASGTASASDGFTPLWVSFERKARLALTEGDPDRFKVANGQPFHLIWWPDPGAPNLKAVTNSRLPTDPRKAYNHQGGRTSFMFTVPMFPAL
jgi:hypothetical protein